METQKPLRHWSSKSRLTRRFLHPLRHTSTGRDGDRGEREVDRRLPLGEPARIIRMVPSRSMPQQRWPAMIEPMLSAPDGIDRDVRLRAARSAPAPPALPPTAVDDPDPRAEDETGDAVDVGGSNPRARGDDDAGSAARASGRCRVGPRSRPGCTSTSLDPAGGRPPDRAALRARGGGGPAGRSSPFGDEQQQVGLADAPARPRGRLGVPRGRRRRRSRSRPPRSTPPAAPPRVLHQRPPVAAPRGSRSGPRTSR